MATDILSMLPEDGLNDEPWFIERRDRDPTPEFDRQKLFLKLLKKYAPAVDAVAIPNSGKLTDWERIRRWNEGARRGALDLIMTWKPTKPGDRGVFFAEFKSGDGMPTVDQRERLNSYFRMGHGCGVYRKPETLLVHLYRAGAPFLIDPQPKEKGNARV